MLSRLPTSEQTAVVTGASSGIGLYTALGLARTGMRVVMAGRDRARTEAARRFVAERSASDREAATSSGAIARSDVWPRAVLGLADLRSCR